MNKSCNIGFLLTPEHSCFNAAFGLAHALQERGHNTVFFVGYKSIFWQYVESHGFKAAKIASLVEGRTTKANRSTGFGLWNRLTRRARDATPKHNGLVDSIKLDLCFLDSIRDDIYPISTVLAEAGLPTILLSYTFASRFQTGCPPVFSSIRPPDTRRPTIGFRIIFALLWLWAVCTWGPGVEGAFRRLRRTFKKLFNRALDFRWERRLRRFGWSSSWSEWKRRPLIPEIVFGHRTLDWPSIASTAGRFYFGVTDLFREKAVFDWSILESNRPIAYCNISTAGRFQEIRVSASGGQSGKPDASKKKEFRVAKRYLDVVIDAFSQRKDWQLILACGPFYESLRGGTVSPNIHLFARVPQLAVLEQADLAITWGGAGTIRECVNFGVPMLVFPVWTDQFGNAARVLARNLGIRGDILHVTPTQMVDMVERALTDKAIRSSVIEMQMQSNKKGEMEDLVHFVRRHTSLEL